MDDALIAVGVIFGLAVVGAMLILPIVALVKAGGAATRVKELTQRLDAMRMELNRLRLQQNAVAAPAVAPEPSPTPAASTAPPTPVSVPTPDIPRAPIVAPPTASPAARVPPPAAAPRPAVPAPAPAARAATPAAAGSSLEERIALVWFTRAGALAVLIGVAYFYKYAVDNSWIGPTGRLILGVLAGLGVLGFAEFTRPRTKPIFVQALLGVGLALLYVSAYASYGFYHLFPIPAAFGAIAVITLLGGALAMRYKAEAVLVLTLLGGLLSPILLSTGEDRPGALFGYLLVLTALSFAVALRMGFRYSVWLAIGGVLALFWGWYAKYWDIRPPPEHPWIDVPAAQLQGKYFPLDARWVPLAAVAAFTALWLAVYWRSRTNRARFQPVALLCTALVLGHAGFAVLLPDHPLYLGLAFTVLAGVSTWLLGLEERRELLSLPLGASLLVLLLTIHGVPQPSILAMLGVLGLWSAVYAGAFLRGQLRQAKRPNPRILVLTGAVGVGFALVAGVLLIDIHPLWFGAVLAALSLAFAVLAWMADAALVGTIAGSITLFGMLGVVDKTGQSHRFILVAAAWAGVYVAAGAYELLVRRLPASPLRLVTLAIASLGFVALAESHTGNDEWTLRAALLAAVGVVDLGIGAVLLERKARQPASVLLGQALALFAAAVACIFSGFTITLVWAGLAAVVAYLAAQSEDRWWLVGALGLFSAALIRLLGFDVSEATRLQDLYFATSGAQGVLRQPVLLNHRAYALVGTAAALLLGARFSARRAASFFRTAATALLTTGHGLLLLLVTSEVLNASLHTPVPAPGLAADEFWSFADAFHASVRSQFDHLSMITTIVFAAYAALLVGIGFGARERVHRYLGLGLFAVGLLKLAAWDVWHLEKLQKMMVLVGVGVLLLFASFLYARFGKRLLVLLREGTVEKAVVLLVAVACGLWSTSALAFDPAQFAEVRPVQGVASAGYYRVEIDPDLYRHSKSEGLADVRVADPTGAEAPWLVREVPIQIPPTHHDATMVDPVKLPGGAARAVFDLGRTGLKHDELRLGLAGLNFVRQTRLEVSNDEIHFDLLQQGDVVYSVAATDARAEATTVRYPTSDSRYLRVTVLAGPDAQALQILSGTVSYVEAASHPLVRSLPAKLEGTVFDLGSAGVPAQALVLDLATPTFERNAQVSASTNQAYWSPAGAGLLFRVARIAGDASANVENARIRLDGTRKRYLKLDVSNGNDAPLEVRGGHVEYRAQELIFRAGAPGAYTLFVGDEAAGPPSYDLANVLSRSGEVPMQEAHFGAVTANPQFGKIVAPPGTAPLSERYPWWVSAGFVVALAALGAWTFRLLRRAKTEEP